MTASLVDSKGVFFPGGDGSEGLALSKMTITDLLPWCEQLKKLGRRADSADLYRCWIAVNGENPFSYIAYFNYGVILSELGDRLGAIKSFRECLQVNPDFIPAHINLGRALEDLGRPGDTLAEWGKATAKLAPITGDKIAHKCTLLIQSGRLLDSLHQSAAAEDALREAFETDPSQSEAILQWINLRQRQCRWPVVVASERVSRESRLVSISPLSLAALTDDPMFQLGDAFVFGKEAMKSLDRAAFEAVPRADRPRAPGPIRVGYVSSDFREHAVGYGLTELFEVHDRGKVEVFAYYCGIERDDPVRQRLKAGADHWIDIRNLGDVEAASRIASDGVDILVDLNGYTKFARTGVFALRPAPIQVNWFGFPGTMGTPYHHYLIADPIVVPASHEIYYSEEILRIPCYQPNDRKRSVAERPPTRAEAGLPDDAFVFCSFNATQKLTRRTFERWITILTQVPNSVLWMLKADDETMERLQHYAEERGIARERIVLAAKLANADHLARYPLADLFLDAFPYGAHTTAADSLWMGVPVLTLTGRSFAARVCTSLVNAAGIGEMACESEAKYVAKAVELANDRAQLEGVKQRLKSGRPTSLLFDTNRLARALEGLYAQMIERHRLGRTPKPDLSNLATYHEIGARMDYEKVEAMGDAEYLAAYREALADCNLYYPVPHDERLWPAPAAAPSRRRAAG